MKKEIKMLFFCLIGSMTLIASLFYYSNASPDNGFNRKFKPAAVTAIKVKDLKYNSWYIAGYDQQFVYLGNYVAPDRLLVVNQITMAARAVKLVIEPKKKMNISQMFVRVDSPYIYLLYGKGSFILRGKIDDYHLKSFIDTDLGFYAHFGFPVSGNSFILKTYDTSKNQYILSKLSKNPPFIQHYPKSLQKQTEGIFSTEGFLRFDREKMDMVFTYVYRNTYTRFDTSINIKDEAHTIDTNLKAKIKVSKIKSANQVVFAEPPLVVNKVSCIAHDLLYVNANLKASNEKMQTYRVNSVVDVYSLIRTRYIFSFYIPDLNKAKISDMQAIAGNLFVLQGSYLSRYKLP